MIPRVCSICEHFELDMGARGYSDATPGIEATIGCSATGSAWPQGDQEVGISHLVKIASNCPKFTPHHDLPKEPE